MTKLLNATLLTQALITFSLTENGKDVIDAYTRYDKYDDRRAELRFAKSLCRLNTYVKKHNFNGFILTALMSEDENVELAKQAYDVINDLIASTCHDSYTEAAR